MAHIFRSPAQYGGGPEISTSYCSCLDCASFGCFIRRHDTENSYRCKHGDGNSCLLFGNNNPNVNNSELETNKSDVHKDDIIEITDARCSSVISAKYHTMTPNMCKQVSKENKPTIDLKGSKVSKQSNNENESVIETIGKDPELETCINLYGDKQKSSPFDISDHMDIEIYENAKTFNDEDIIRKYSKRSSTDGKIKETILEKSNSYSKLSQNIRMIPPTDNIYKEILTNIYIDEEEKNTYCIPRLTVNYNADLTETNKILDNENAPVHKDAEVIHIRRKDSKHSAAKLAAEVMNLSYEDFRKTALYQSPTKVKPAMTTYDIIQRIKEAYEICSCKICECISSITAQTFKKDTCNCKPCDCSDCKKYRMGSSDRQRKTLELLRNFDNNETTICKCIPCHCDECKYFHHSKVVVNKPCNCTPCQCIECKALGVNKNRTVIVAPLREGNRRPYCSCTICGCFECAHPYGTIAQTGTRTQTQEMSTETTPTQHMNCACVSCNNTNCEQEGENTCSCNNHNRVTKKPVRNDKNDYDIRKVIVSPLLDAEKLRGIDSDIDKTLFRTFSRDVMDWKHSCSQSESNSELTKTHRAPNIWDTSCDCKQRNCQYRKTYNLLELQQACDCKPYDYSECSLNNSHQFLLDGYMNQLVYDLCDSNSQGRLAYLSQTVEKKKCTNNYKQGTQKHKENRDNGEINSTNENFDVDQAVDDGVMRTSSYTIVSQGSQNSKNSTEQNLKTSNILSQKPCDDLNQFTFPRRTTVENCLRDVMALKKLNIFFYTAELRVAFTIGNRKFNSNSITPRRIQMISQENDIDMNPSGSKSIGGHTTQVKLCNNLNYAEPCECNSCICKIVAIEKVDNNCQCNCGACDCFDMCLHHKLSISRNCKFTQTSAFLVLTVDKESNTPTFHKDSTSLQNYLNLEEYTTPSTNQFKQLSQEADILNLEKIRVPGKIKYIDNHASHSHHSFKTFDKTDLSDRKSNCNNNVKKILEQAKAYSSKLLKILQKYEKANKDFMSPSQKLKQPHTVLFKSDDSIIVPADIDYTENKQLCKINDMDNEIQCSGIEENAKNAKGVEDEDIILKTKPEVNDPNKYGPDNFKETCSTTTNEIEKTPAGLTLTSAVKDKHASGENNTGKIQCTLKRGPMKLAIKDEIKQTKTKEQIDKNKIVAYSCKADDTETRPIRLKIVTCDSDGNIIEEQIDLDNLENKTDSDSSKSDTKTRLMSLEVITSDVDDNHDTSEANDVKIKNKSTDTIKHKQNMVKSKINNARKPKETEELLELYHNSEIVTETTDPYRKVGTMPVCKKQITSAVRDELKRIKHSSNVSQVSSIRKQDTSIDVVNDTIKSDEFNKIVYSDIHELKTVIQESKININKTETTVKDKHELNYDKSHTTELGVRKYKRDTLTCKKNNTWKKAAVKSKTKDETKVIQSPETTENNLNPPIIDPQSDQIKSKDVTDYNQKPSRKCELNKSSQKYLIKDDYDFIAQEMYKSITGTSYTDIRHIIANISNTKSAAENISTETLVTESEIVKHDETQTLGKELSIKFINILNFIKKYRPEMYEDIAKVITSPQIESDSGQASRVTVILKNDIDDIQRNDSHEIQLKTVEQHHYFPFLSIKPYAELKTKVMKDLYESIFRVNNTIIRTPYLPTLNVDGNLDLKKQDVLDKQLTVKENIRESLDSNRTSENVKSSTSDERITNVTDDLEIDAVNRDTILKQITRNIKVLKCSDEALAPLRVDLNTSLNKPPLLPEQMPLVKSDKNTELKDINMENPVSEDQHINQTCDVEPESLSVIKTNDDMGNGSTDLDFQEKDKSKIQNDYSIEELFEIRNKNEKKHKLQDDRHRNKIQDSSKKMMEPKRFTGDIQSWKAAHKDLQHKTKVFPASQDREGGKINFRSVRKVSNHTLCVKWDVPKDTRHIQGYELLVDGRPVDQILSPHRGVAVVTCLPRSDRVILTVRSITDDADHDNPSTDIVYHRRRGSK